MGTSPSGDTYNEDAEGLPLLNGPTEFGIIHPDVTLFTTDSKRECIIGDLIFCVRGSTTGRMNWADQPYSLGRGVCAIRGTTLLDTKFIKYVLDYQLASLLKKAGGGTFPNLTKDTIHNFPIPYPKHRRKIAAVLSTYDDAIENNTWRIALLEEAAQALYREWFVEFRYPGHEDVPLVESELGMIPQGWKVGVFTDVADVLSGGTPKTKVKEYWENGKIPFFTARDTGDSFYVMSIEKHITELGLKNCRSPEYPPNMIFITARGTVGKVRMPAVPMAMNQSCYALEGHERFPQYFIFMMIKEYVEHLQQRAHGAVFDTIITDTFRMLEVVIPPNELVVRFVDDVEIIFQQIRNLLFQNQSLREARDGLLPRLVSGEMDMSALDVM